LSALLIIIIIGSFKSQLKTATTLGKLFTPMCLCSPSSIIWYLARAFMCVWQHHGSNEQGEYCSSGSACSDRL